MTDHALRQPRPRALAVLLMGLALCAAAPARAAEPAATGSVVGPTVAVPPAPANAASPAAVSAVSPPAHDPSRPAAHAAASAVAAAGDPAVTIKDFSFGPSAVTIHVGDTIAWTNDGPTAHTATGSGFDTGILRAGQSSSHTFSTAGTFSYHCTLHPFMKGTITVVASAAPRAAAPTSSAQAAPPATAATPPTAAPPAPATATAQAQALPNTGLDAWQVAALGALSLLCGLALRRVTRPRSARTSRAPRGL